MQKLTQKNPVPILINLIIKLQNLKILMNRTKTIEENSLIGEDMITIKTSIIKYLNAMHFYGNVVCFFPATSHFFGEKILNVHKIDVITSFSQKWQVSTSVNLK